METFNVSNPYTIYNIYIYLEKYTNGKYECISDSYTGSRSNLKFVHKTCVTIFENKFINPLFLAMFKIPIQKAIIPIKYNEISNVFLHPSHIESTTRFKVPFIIPKNILFSISYFSLLHNSNFYCLSNKHRICSFLKL